MGPVAVSALSCLLLLRPVLSSTQNTTIFPGFTGTQMDWIDNRGLFLLSPSKAFAFGFRETSDPNLFHLAVVHQTSAVVFVVWKANTATPVSNDDHFVFSSDGDVYLLVGNGSRAWSTNTKGKRAASLHLRDDGNLVLLGADAKSPPLWQSFDHPTDTILSGQNLTAGMEVVSEPGDRNLTYRLEITTGDVLLRVGFPSPQPYWSIWTDKTRIDQVTTREAVATAVISGNSWNFYGGRRNLLTQIILSPPVTGNTTWAAVLDKDGFISFKNLVSGDAVGRKLPEDLCHRPASCKPYQVCSGGVGGESSSCSCPPVLNSVSNCDPGAAPPTCGDNTLTELAEIQGVGYFALSFTTPASRGSDLAGCKNSCSSNCSCVALFFDQSSGSCFHFDEIGSLKKLSGSPSETITCFVKIPSTTTRGGSGGGGVGGGSKTTTIVAIIIPVLTAFVVVGLVYSALRVRRNWNNGSMKQLVERCSDEVEEEGEEEDLLGSMAGMPVRYSYSDLQQATNNFSEKLGKGGFGSVYLGSLPDGSRIAVKKLEGIGQGRKEFRAEVSIIGSIHHIHLVKLRGFCTEGHHRLLAYEFLPNGSLDRWLFRQKGGGGAAMLDWETRYGIALGTAKGLAYLHEDCAAKIVHCDIKPENVLLDENFAAKVSDFGLAKLMTREQSHVFTTLRGTRGYLAPEWIISSAISEKSDVYSFGMVLLEIVAGRKSFDAGMASEKAHLPTFAFRMVEEGRAKEVVDVEMPGGCLDEDERVEVAVKVALCCIQEDASLRPSMGKVVQMLEGVAEVPPLPPSSQMGFRLYPNILKCMSDGMTTSSAPSTDTINSDAFKSAVRLSGPR